MAGNSGGPALAPAARADVRRNLTALLDAAADVFAEQGVDAPVRAVAERAGLGIATLYRHFPTRSGLVAAVMRREIDACADAAPDLAAAYPPAEALSRWMHRYAAFIAAKRGLSAALHGGEPAFDTLPTHFEERLVPALRSLVDAGVAAGEIRSGVDAGELMSAVGRLGMSAGSDAAGRTGRMVDLLMDGMRFGALR